jgi:electron transfer flavoprotein-quinone oxidoreductase
VSDGEYEHYEAVVVGAGPGGAAAAARLAEAGVETLVLERGVEAGAKNVSGGVIYAEESAPYTIDDLFDGFREAATERPVTASYIHNVAGDRVRTFDITDLHEHDTEWADAVLRRRMDAWLAERVHERTAETGGGLLTDVRVDGLLWADADGEPIDPDHEGDERGAHVVGVTCEEIEPVTADLIVAADGVNSGLARAAGLMDWEEPEEWFQGVKVVAEMPGDLIEERFGIGPDEGEAHLFSGDLYQGVRGGGFLYTNRESLSIGNVFHLDSIVEEGVEVSDLVDALLTHPLLGRWLDEDYTELEYSAKLVPDSKKVALREPYRGRLLVVGDAAGQMQAQGPIIKGMNHAVTAGALAAEAHLETRRFSRGPGERYAEKLRDTRTMAKLRPRAYRLSRAVAEREAVTGAVDAVVDSAVGRLGLRALSRAGVVGRLYNSPAMMRLLPDSRTPYVTLPTALAAAAGEPIAEENGVEPPDLGDRIGALTYDVDEPHILLRDNSWAASGAAVAACPVSAADYGGGCYRAEEVRRNGESERVVSLDTQPCVECGTCAVVADTDWEHPGGGKGVAFEQG